jgi:hypothetical protein
MNPQTENQEEEQLMKVQIQSPQRWRDGGTETGSDG